MSPSARFTLFGIAVILGWSYLRRVDSHIIISEGYVSDPLHIPMEFLLGYQDRSGTFDVILGHFPSLSRRDNGFFSMDLLQFSSLDQETFACFTGHHSFDFR